MYAYYGPFWAPYFPASSPSSSVATMTGCNQAGCNLPHPVNLCALPPTPSGTRVSSALLGIDIISLRSGTLRPHYLFAPPPPPPHPDHDPNIWPGCFPRIRHVGGTSRTRLTVLQLQKILSQLLNPPIIHIRYISLGDLPPPPQSTRSTTIRSSYRRTCIDSVLHVEELKDARAERGQQNMPQPTSSATHRFILMSVVHNMK